MRLHRCLRRDGRRRSRPGARDRRRQCPGDDHPARRLAVQRGPRVHARHDQVPGAGAGILRRRRRVRHASEQRARPREAVFRVHVAGHLGRLRDRLAGAHVDLLAGGAVHRRAVPVPRSRPLECGAGERRAPADRRRARGARGRDADRLCRRRHAQHLLEHRGDQPRRDPGPEDPRAGRADLELDLLGDRHVADRDRLQRGLQRDPERRHQRRRERGGRRRADEVLRGRAEPRHDPARDHDPAAVLLQGDLRSPARGPAGGDPARRQGSGRLRPRDRILRGCRQARRDGAAGAPQAHSRSRGATR